MTAKQQTQKTNYEIFIETVNSLKNSQGFYSRIVRDLNKMSDEQREQVKVALNKLPQWNDTLDCVLYLEQ